MPPPAKAIPCVAVIGPTASGKTRLGVNLARRFAGEIVSADSRQVYRHLDIGTGKDLAEYQTAQGRIPTHLIDIADPGDCYNLYRFVHDASQALRQIREKKKLPIMVGGTPLYINALLERYEMPGNEPDPKLRQQLEPLNNQQLRERLQTLAPELYERTDTTQRPRLLRALEIAASQTSPQPPEKNLDIPLLDALLMAPYYPRKVLHERIEKRLKERLQQGMIEEVQQLHDDHGLTWEQLEFLGLEYRFVALLLQGRLDRREFEEKLLAAIRHFCKAQDIWYRKMERQGKVIHWLPEGNPEQATSLVQLFLDQQPLPPPALQLKDIYYGPKSPK